MNNDIDNSASLPRSQGESLDEPSSSPSNGNGNGNGHHSSGKKSSMWSRLKYVLNGSSDTSLREALEEYVDKPEDDETQDRVTQQEKTILSNILQIRDMPVVKVMVPRANIVAIDVNTSNEDLFALFASKQYSRIPVYQDSLDDVLGTIHLKDIVGAMAKGEKIVLRDLLTEIPIVSPFMPVLDLMITMRDSRRHMALVVDEFGGIDGLVTIGDVIENIIGEIDDEHDIDHQPQIIEDHEGAVLVDARVDIDEFEGEYGTVFSDNEREESETLGGVVFTLAGRVPVRGEVLTHESGTVFEILDADQRRIKRIKVSNIPDQNSEAVSS